MVETGTFERITSVFSEVFDDDSLVATSGLNAHDVDGWDSLGNVRLFVEFEREFSVRFSAAQMNSLRKVGELVALIEGKISHIAS